jgi:hypothetical protein
MPRPNITQAKHHCTKGPPHVPPSHSSIPSKNNIHWMGRPQTRCPTRLGLYRLSELLAAGRWLTNSSSECACMCSETISHRLLASHAYSRGSECQSRLRPLQPQRNHQTEPSMPMQNLYGVNADNYAKSFSIPSCNSKPITAAS